MRHRYSSIRIVIADDHEIFREGFKLLFKNQDEIELIGEADNGKELLQIIAREHPDVAIVDIKMPVMDGIEATKQIRKLHPETRVIALSMFNDDNFIIDMLEAGASGYLLKNTNKAELLQATRAVYEGSTYYCNATSNKLTKMIAESKFNPYRDHPVKKFTPREIEVMKYICEQTTNKEIATNLGLSIRTVESHRERILEKTGAKNMVGVAVYAIRHKIYEV